MKYVPEGDLHLQLTRFFDQGITFTDNLDVGLVEVTTTGAQQEVTHSLGRVPIGFIVVFKDAECDIWGELLSSWTSEIMYLNASATNVTARLYVM